MAETTAYREMPKEEAIAPTAMDETEEVMVANRSMFFTAQLVPLNCFLLRLGHGG